MHLALPIPAQAAALLIPQDAHFGLGTPTVPDPELPVAPSEGQLLTWARDAYGGITSYSKLRDPSWVRLRLGEGAWGWHWGAGVGSNALPAPKGHQPTGMKHSPRGDAVGSDTLGSQHIPIY